MRYLSILFTISLLTGCEVPQTATPKFHEGDIVKSRIKDALGVIKNVSCHQNCTYDVRFSAQAILTDTRIMSNDGPINSPLFEIVYDMKEYELERANK